MVTATAAADMIEQMLDLDARAQILWHKAAEQLRAGDIIGAVQTMVSVAEELAQARDLGETCARAVYDLATAALAAHDNHKPENLS